MTPAAAERVCPVCGSMNREPLYHPTASPGPVVRCRSCGFVLVSRIEQDRAIIDDGKQLASTEALLTSSNVDDLADCWELSHLSSKLDERPALHQNARDALARIGAVRPSPGRLLDFGCGWGFFLEAAREQGWSIFGLEPLPGHAVYARGVVGAEVKTDILRDDSYPESYFDVITAFQVFEHLPHPAEDLARLARFLKPGGVLLIEVPNVDTWGVRLLGKWHRHFVADHLNFFSAETLGRLMATKGLNVVDTYYPTRTMSVRHLTTAWAGRFLPRSLGGGLTQTLQATSLWERTVRLNLGDIVALIGQKPSIP